VTCDGRWHTLAAQLSGWIGERRMVCGLSADLRRRWRLDGRECPDVEGCVDVDLAFSPATNLLPIRRLGLAVGDTASVRAAWLRFPEMRLEPLEQRYTRVDAERYRYASAAGDETFEAELRVAPSGLVIDYSGLWTREACE
jgi:hypothetical protein